MISVAYCNGSFELNPNLAKLGISKLTDIQKECIQLLLLSSEDLYVVLPTGTGKSILFQLAPFIQDNTGIYADDVLALSLT